MGDENENVPQIVSVVPTKNPRSKILWIIIISFVVVVIAISGFVFLYFNYFQYPIGTWGCLNEDGVNEKNVCILEEAIESQDSSLCASIHQYKERGECLQAIEQDPVLCEDFTLTEKEYCYIAAAKYTRDTKTCLMGPDTASLGFDDFAQVKCAKELAVELKDPEACKPIMDGRGWCLAAVALDLRDITVCDGISEDTYKEGCLIDVAKLTVNLSVCDILTLSSRRDQCFKAFSLILDDPELCEKVTFSRTKSYCFMNSAKDLDSVEICDRISEDDIKNECEIELEPINNSFAG